LIRSVVDNLFLNKGAFEIRYVTVFITRVIAKQKEKMVTKRAAAVGLSTQSNMMMNHNSNQISELENSQVKKKSAVNFLSDVSFYKTRSSAIAEGPRDASCQLKSCQLPHNSAETTYTTSPDQIDGMKLEI